MGETENKWALCDPSDVAMQRGFQQLKLLDAATQSLQNTKVWRDKKENAPLLLIHGLSLGLLPLESLTELTMIGGKVTMSAELMSRLIRQAGHCIKVLESSETVCKLLGSRSDTGDEATVEFSIQQAEKAGLMRNPSWQKYPEDMLWARAISRLKRRLFSDVVGRAYVTGELDDEPSRDAPLERPQAVVEEQAALISDEDVQSIQRRLQAVPHVEQAICKKWGSVSEVPASRLEFVLQMIAKAEAANFQ